MPNDHADKSSQGFPKDAAYEAPVNPTGKGTRKPILVTVGWFPPSRPRRGCEDC